MKNAAKCKKYFEISRSGHTVFFVVVLSSPFPAQEGTNSVCLHHRGNRATKSSCGIRVIGQRKRRQWEFDRWVFDGRVRKCTA